MARAFKVLSGAQSFGYGPSAKLGVLTNYLHQQGVTVDFWGQEIALRYARLNSPPDRRIYRGDLLSTLDAKPYGAVMTVMDPRVAAWGYFYDLPVLAIDSLFWFWDWSAPSEMLMRMRENIRRLKAHASLDDLLAYIGSLPDHLQQYATHFMASRSFAQHYPGCHRVRAVDDGLHVVEVGPIVDLAYKHQGVRDTVLVSFSGTLNPLMTHDDAMTYLQLVRVILAPALERLQGVVRTVVTVHPSLVEEARALFPGSVGTLAHGEFLETVNRSIAVIAPAGITTLYECVMYETPIFVLPEQHDGHFRNYTRLTDLAEDVGEFRRVFPETLVNYRAPIDAGAASPDYVAALYAAYKRFLADPQDRTVASMRAHMCDRLAQINDQKVYCAYRDAQKMVMRPMLEQWPNAAAAIEVALSPYFVD
jgi:hypothetical protein